MTPFLLVSLAAVPGGTGEQEPLHDQMHEGSTMKSFAALTNQPQEPEPKMESHTAVATRPSRPKVTDRAITSVAAAAMLPALAEWNGEPLTDEEVASVLRLLPGMAYSDTYEMAREFERDGWDANSELVNTLEGWDYVLRNAHHTAVREWMTTNDVRPRFAAGAAVNVPREQNMTGEVASVDEQRGTYTVRIDALGHVREGVGTHGRVFVWEEVEDATPDSHA